jgi:hypothetical protein
MICCGFMQVRWRLFGHSDLEWGSVGIDEVSPGASIVHVLVCVSVLHEGIDLSDLLFEEGRRDGCG